MKQREEKAAVHPFLGHYCQHPSPLLSEHDISREVRSSEISKEIYVVFFDKLSLTTESDLKLF